MFWGLYTQWNPSGVAMPATHRFKKYTQGIVSRMYCMNYADKNAPLLLSFIMCAPGSLTPPSARSFLCIATLRALPWGLLIIEWARSNDWWRATCNTTSTTHNALPFNDSYVYDNTTGLEQGGEGQGREWVNEDSHTAHIKVNEHVSQQRELSQLTIVPVAPVAECMHREAIDVLRHDWRERRDFRPRHQIPTCQAANQAGFIRWQDVAAWTLQQHRETLRALLPHKVPQNDRHRTYPSICVTRYEEAAVLGFNSTATRIIRKVP